MRLSAGAAETLRRYPPQFPREQYCQYLHLILLSDVYSSRTIRWHSPSFSWYRILLIADAKMNASLFVRARPPLLRICKCELAESPSGKFGFMTRYLQQVA